MKGPVARTSTLAAMLLATTACATAQTAPVERAPAAQATTATVGTVPIQPAQPEWAARDAEMDRFMEVWMEVMGPADSQANG